MTRVRRSVFVVMMDLPIVLRDTGKFFPLRKRIARSFKKKKKRAGAVWGASRSSSSSRDSPAAEWRSVERRCESV